MAANNLRENPNYEKRVDETRASIAREMPREASIAVIAGSGLGGFVRSVTVEKNLSYSSLPHVGSSTVAGHSGTLIYGVSGEVPLFLLSGRRHLYEGLLPQDSTLLLRALLLEKNIRNVVITNAAGGLNPTFQVGDLMLISDHINWTFRNPLIGKNNEDWGDRFPDLSDIYPASLRSLAKDAAISAGVTIREGVYLAGHGPSYETRAEVGMLRHMLGADAVGMSTVPEALVCAHMHRGTVGISFISNLLIEPAKTSHEEVMENSKKVEEKFAALMSALLPKLA